MPDTLLLTKVSLPILRNILVPREKVLRQLREGIHDGHLLTLVSAPAGYGKTTTIRMWVEEAGQPVAWVSLEKSDNDLNQFITYILTALQQAEDDLGQTALEIVESGQEINFQQILGILVNDLYELSQPIILVLEDYHLIENEKIDQFVELILNQAPAKLHLVITTREDPSLPLTRLRVRNQLTEIRAADLSFSLDEASDFFSKVMGVHLPQKEMEVLESRTEGWAAGLQLAALSLKGSVDKAKFVEAFRGTHRHVLDYLIEEVLKSQPEDIKEFLRRTSILDQLSPSLCEAVTGQKDSGEYLQRLENNNLFLISLDEERTWYRYHALFAELLMNQLLQAEPERIDELYERAAGWYEKNGFIQKAVEHAFQISNYGFVSQLIEKHSMPMLYKGEVSIIVEWFDRLPEAHIKNSPRMCVFKSWALALMHDLRDEELKQTMRHAENAASLPGVDEGLRNLIDGYIASIQAYLLQSTALDGEKPQKLIEASQNALRLLPNDEKGICSVNALNIGYGYLSLADLSSAQEAYQQAFECGIVGGNLYAAVYGQIDLIVIAMMKGQLQSALQLCEANIERFNRLLAGQRFPPIGDLYILHGSILLEENLLVEADQALSLGLSLIRFTGEYEARFRVHSTMARLRAIQGDQPGMLESLNILTENGPESAFYSQIMRHRILTRGSAIDKSQLDEARLYVENSSFKFKTLPDMTRLDLVSRVRFQDYLSMAHILTRLAIQNPKAYQLADAHRYFARLENFLEAPELYGWLIEIWIARALMNQVEGKMEDAYGMIEKALGAAAPRGYFRIFLDEGELMRSLLESVAPRLKDGDLSAYALRLLEAMPGESEKVKPVAGSEEILSEREVEVLRLLATGESYKEIGQKLFLSLNTVQFHVKNIYRKLSVNKRAQVIQKAQEIKLI